MFADMKRSGMKDKEVEWYIDVLSTLLSISIVDVYDSKSEFEKCLNDIEEDYSKFENDILKPKAKA